MNTPGSARQSGTTPSEKFIASLCEKSFLQLWSYSNIFRDQGKHKSGDGKEICDLLSIFGNHITIFSDKECKFPRGEITLSWKRWYKKAIHNSARQIFGAERWLRNHSDRVFLDRSCEQPFPLDIPNSKDMSVHRVIVASGAASACRIRDRLA